MFGLRRIGDRGVKYLVKKVPEGRSVAAWFARHAEDQIKFDSGPSRLQKLAGPGDRQLTRLSMRGVSMRQIPLLAATCGVALFCCVHLNSAMADPVPVDPADTATMKALASDLDSLDVYYNKLNPKVGTVEYLIVRLVSARELKTLKRGNGDPAQNADMITTDHGDQYIILVTDLFSQDGDVTAHAPSLASDLNSLGEHKWDLASWSDKFVIFKHVVN